MQLLIGLKYNKMKIAFILYSGAVISGKSNGIRSQAITWGKILREKGFLVDFIDNWGSYEWSSYQAIHIFGYDLSISTFVANLSKFNNNIFLSPIIDSTKSYYSYKLASYNKIDKLRLLSINSSLKKATKYLKGICVRSNHEYRYFSDSFSLPKEKIYKIYLSYGLPEPNNIEAILKIKENYCLHVSSLYQKRKNVKLLIDAAKEKGFNLKLVGNTGNLEQEQMIKSWIGDAENIQLLGYVKYEELLDLYKKAKVFVLPSINEGVGIVGLDAGVFGCNVVVTNIPGPKEYYPKTKTVTFVDPSNKQDIASKVFDSLMTENNRVLHDYISSNHSSNQVFVKLKEMYESN